MGRVNSPNSSSVPPTISITLATPRRDMSGTPALAQFGRTLVAGIGTAVLFAPLALTLGARSPARG